MVDFREVLSQRILVGRFLVGRLGVRSALMIQFAYNFQLSTSRGYNFQAYIQTNAPCRPPPTPPQHPNHVGGIHTSTTLLKKKFDCFCPADIVQIIRSESIGLSSILSEVASATHLVKGAGTTTSAYGWATMNINKSLYIYIVYIYIYIYTYIYIYI